MGRRDKRRKRQRQQARHAQRTIVGVDSACGPDATVLATMETDEGDKVIRYTDVRVFLNGKQLDITDFNYTPSR